MPRTGNYLTSHAGSSIFIYARRQDEQLAVKHMRCAEIRAICDDTALLKVSTLTRGFQLRRRAA
jgi:hypothetical protein